VESFEDDVVDIFLRTYEQPVFPKICVWCGEHCPRSGIGLKYYYYAYNSTPGSVRTCFVAMTIVPLFIGSFLISLSHFFTGFVFVFLSAIFHIGSRLFFLASDRSQSKSGRILVRAHPKCGFFLKVSYYSKEFVSFSAGILTLAICLYFRARLLAFILTLASCFLSFLFMDWLFPSPFDFIVEENGFRFFFKHSHLAKKFKELNSKEG